LIDFLRSISPRALWVAAAFVALLVLLEVARARVRRWLVTWRLRRRSYRALDAEAWAARALARAGYAVVGSQVRASYELFIDGRPMSVALRADYVVRRRGRTFVAEVKSGELAPCLETATTRRQLLEYRVAFDVDGVLLVDADARTIHEVTFPLALQNALTMSRQANLAAF